jgi:hypothetical protein
VSAARDWEKAAALKFTDLTGKNGSVLFNVRPAAYWEEQDNPYTIASTFFPHYGSKVFIIYKRFFRQTDEEQMLTLRHELGHILGLRHEHIWKNGEQVEETYLPAQIINAYDPASIMFYPERPGYAGNGRLSALDKAGIRQLYGSSLIGGSNRPPVARNDDIGIIDSWDSLTIYPLRNDSDPDRDSLVIISVSNSAGGEVINYGNCVYLSPGDWEGRFSFTYTISDRKGGIDQADVFFEVYTDDY